VHQLDQLSQRVRTAVLVAHLKLKCVEMNSYAWFRLKMAEQMLAIHALRDALHGDTQPTTIALQNQ
jgi:hypothetical protein